MIVTGFIKSDAIADALMYEKLLEQTRNAGRGPRALCHRQRQGIWPRYAHAAILESTLPHIKASSHVLDVGASTGVFAAMLRHCTGKDGVTVSLLPSTVVELAKQNMIADGLDQALQEGRILVVKGDEKSRFAQGTPYDVIHVTKVVDEIPPLLLKQLASPGHMVMPVLTDGRGGRDTMIQVDKDAAGDVSQKELSDLKI
ncbi:protein-L-isoaspartate O-methyltransferase-domain-containing protein [Lactarius psammicola]|nr:protein-L-isoaspartate O-methyltransferase-domain-containing protein [Lactarius psammicola]